MKDRLLLLVALVLVVSGGLCMWVACGSMNGLVHPMHMLAMFLAWALILFVGISLGRMGWEAMRERNERRVCPDCGRQTQPDWQHCPWCNARLH